MRLDTDEGGPARPSERRADLLGIVAFDEVAHLVAVEVVELDAALQPGPDLVGVVLEALEGGHLALVHDLAPAPQAGRGAAGDLALGDEAAGDEALGQREDGPDLGRPELDFLDVG